MAELLTARPALPHEIAAKITEVLSRNEQARIYHWLNARAGFPPRRRPPQDRGKAGEN